MKYILLVCFFLQTSILPQANKDLQEFSTEFFNWRRLEQPINGDDIPRIERHDNWSANYSPDALSSYKKKYVYFKNKLSDISKHNWTRSDSVDFLLLHSAVERVNWELNILKLPNRDPNFYVEQSLGEVLELLVLTKPFNDSHCINIIIRLEAIPKILDDAKLNLSKPVKVFAQNAISILNGIDKKLAKVDIALKKVFPNKFYSRLDSSIIKSSKALLSYKNWLIENEETMADKFNVGRNDYSYFLKNIALVPYSPEKLLEIGHTELNRSVSLDILESQRDLNAPQMKIFKSVGDQISQGIKDEQEIRDFIREKYLMTIPKWVHHYKNELIPEYVAPIADLGMTDDLTSATRLNEDGVSYIPEPSENMSFFRLATAKDPRPIIIHEGFPGHYFQLVRSWANDDPIRRHYFDSNSNEGIGFYFEEMMLQMGLFDQSPRTREIIYHFMRLRALRVNVDVNLALGKYGINQAAKYLAKTTPMDFETAKDEAAFFASTPGQGITYQIGKAQILNFLSDAKLTQGKNFSLKNFHDYLLVNGNVPISLQRWEYLGLKDEISKLWPSK